ncbi:MAG: hypothetical protein WD342_08405 [Verrucomicrobiales bacterium]
MPGRSYSLVSSHGGKSLSWIVAAMLGFGLARAQEADVPERIDLSNFPGEIVDKVVVPIPAEIFAVLDKLDEPDWNSGIDLPEEKNQGKERAVLALTFGSLVGEGFIAVQAKNADEIQKIGRRVLSLSESLGLAGAVRPHSLSIIETAGERDWEAVRDELDSTQQTVRDTMKKLRDEELSELVSLGGWLRGTNVVTTFIADSFSEDKAELLNQPGLISHFRSLLESMEGPAKNSPRIRAISTGLARLDAIITRSGDLSEGDIAELRDISRSMLEEYYFSNSANDAATAN